MFDCFGVCPIYKLPFDNMPYNEHINALSHQPNELLVPDFAALVRLLYQLSVLEQNLKAAMAADNQTPAARQMAVLVLDRHFEKMKTRRLYSTKPRERPNTIPTSTRV